jgi:hypothetical protein
MERINMNHRTGSLRQAVGSALLALAGLLWLPFPASAASTKLGALPAGMSPDSVDFTASEVYVLDRGTISVYSLPDLVLRRTFCGSGTAAGQLSRGHNWDQAVRIASGKVIAEDDNNILFFTPDGRFLSEKTKPADTTWFIPIGDRYVAKSMIATGNPPLQYIRVVLFDAGMKEIKELYRQKWFQQQNPPGFTTEFPGDLLHYAVADDKIFIDRSPEGWSVGIFDAGGRELSTLKKDYTPIPMTPADRERETTQVRREKRVAAMIRRAGSWEKLRDVWSFAFSDFKPALRELQAYGENVLARTFEQKGDETKFALLDPQGRVQKELFLPVGTDAETEARVCGTAFYKIIDGRVYFLRHNLEQDVWEVHVATVAGL